MGSVLPQTLVRTRSERGRAGFTPELDLSDTGAKRAQRSDEKRDALRWTFTARIAPYFDRGCEVYCRDLDAKASTLADEMGVSASVLSEMRQAKRIIGAEHVEVLRRHPPARAILAEADRPPIAITLSSVERTLLKVVIEDAARGDRGANALLDEVARRLNVEREDVEAVVERGEDVRPEGAPDA